MQDKIVIIKERIIRQFSRVETMLKLSAAGLQEQDKTKLEQVMQELETQVNAAELIIEEECTNYIALFTPEAKNLRSILMILKMNNDAERAGDLAVNIAESAAYLIERPELKQDILDDLSKMTDTVLKMFHDSITSFVDENSELAQQVIKQDHKVNHLQEKILHELRSSMIDDTSLIKRGLHFIRIAHNLERVGDLATNICEDTIYVIEGNIVKHLKRKEKRNG